MRIKKFSLILAMVILAALTLVAAVTTNFLASSISLDATVTKVIVTDFPDHKISLTYGWQDTATIICTFTRAAGSASTVDYTIQASPDWGTTWVPFYVFQIPTNTAAVTGNIVRKLFSVNLPVGFTDLRCYSIYNSDGSNNLTAVNISISLKW